jgi:hypothetical protein
VLASTPGSAKPIFRTVSKLIVLFGMGECDYRQEQEPFQVSQLVQIALALNCWRTKREIGCSQQLSLNHENRGLSSAVSILPTPRGCTTGSANAKSVRREADKSASNG